MKKIRLFILLALTIFAAKNVNAQVNFEFTTQEEVDQWEGAQCILSNVNGCLQQDVTGSFWAVTTYAPEGGFEWDFDAYPICAIKLEKKYGDLFLKLNHGDGDYKLSAGISAGDGIKVLNIKDSEALIHIFVFEDYNADEATKDAFVGKRNFVNLQLASEYVEIGQKIQFDWIKSFTDAESALDYIMPIVDGTGSVSGNQIDNNLIISGSNNSILIDGMTETASIEIFSISGQIIKKATMMNGVVENIPAGMYIVRTCGQSKIVAVK